MQPSVRSPDAVPRAYGIRPARIDDIYPILQLHRAAFSDKFGAAFGTHGADRGVEAMAEAWRRQGAGALRGMFVAVLDDCVVGTASMRTWEMGGDSSGAVEIAFHNVLGPWGALRSSFALSLLNHTINRSEGYITDVAVHAAYRRRGIARSLLGRVEAEARQVSKRFLGLYVSASNTGARQLYDRAGFVHQRTRRSWTALWMLRQSTWIYMRKDLY